jgi:hypothetical protein
MAPPTWRYNLANDVWYPHVAGTMDCFSLCNLCSWTHECERSETALSHRAEVLLQRCHPAPEHLAHSRQL